MESGILLKFLQIVDCGGIFFIESRPEDALVKLVKTVETVETVENVETVKTEEIEETVESKVSRIAP